MTALIKPRPARPYIRGQALKERQAQTTAELMAWVELQRFTAERLPKLTEIAPIPRMEGDPFAESRALFAHMPSASAGRAMAAKAFADAKESAAFEKAIGEAFDAGFMLEWPELDDVEFFKTGGFPL